ncbi:hypothetical protein ACFO4O_00830 [Glaciecola siphonariae]|uniref:Uncharacterized protein n=1 Tax=Glaciecola siphonariae TaxID=521012 RepID=A0ABV9LT69_9ALTE
MKINYFGLALGIFAGALCGDLIASFLLPEQYEWASTLVIGVSIWACAYIGAYKLPA